MKPIYSAKRLAYQGLCLAFLCVCAQVIIPLPAIPITLGLLGVYMAALVLPRWDAMPVIVAYLLLGAVGAPVFAGLKGGLASLIGPTGGYLIGYLLAAGTICLFKPRIAAKRHAMLVLLLALILCYAPGALWFHVQTGRSVKETLSLTILPFIPGDAIKILLAVCLAPLIQKYAKGISYA